MDPHAEPSPRPAGAGLARQLTGDLPCVRCGYNLRGLSVRVPCPECGTAVRATILSAVDPYAGVLRPIDRPRLTSTLFFLWAAGAMGAVLATWVLRLADALQEYGVGTPDVGRLVVGAVVCIGVSAVGAVSLIRPHAGIPRWQAIAAALGVVCYAPLGVLYWRLHGRFDAEHLPPYLRQESALPHRAELRLAMAAVIGAAILCLRPNARLLAVRSLVLRTGRVDRQTMLALVASLVVAALGDGMHLASTRLGAGPLLLTVGTFFIAVGSMLFTVGLAGVLLDVWRIRPVLVTPAPSARQVLGRGP